MATEEVGAPARPNVKRLRRKISPLEKWKAQYNFIAERIRTWKGYIRGGGYVLMHRRNEDREKGFPDMLRSERESIVTYISRGQKQLAALRAEACYLLVTREAVAAEARELWEKNNWEKGVGAG